MSRNALLTVDAGLDYFFNYQRRWRSKRVVVRRLTRKMLAHCIEKATKVKISPVTVSSYLQIYRESQETVATTYHLASRGYGRAAMWYVLSGPTLPAVTSEGMIMAHAEWISADLGARAVSDFMRELIPAAQQHPVIEPRMQASVVKVERVLRDLLDDIKTDKQLWEQATGRTAEVVPSLTSIEVDLAEELNHV